MRYSIILLMKPRMLSNVPNGSHWSAPSSLGIFGTVLLIWPNTSMNVICTLLGVLMVVFGVSKIVGYFFNVSYHIGFQFDLALGLFALLFGILFLTHPGAILSITWVLVGIYEIVESVFKIRPRWMPATISSPAGDCFYSLPSSICCLVFS